MGTFCGANVFKKGAFCLLALPNQMLFLTISNKNIFFRKSGHQIGYDNYTQQRSRTDPEKLILILNFNKFIPLSQTVLT